METGYEYWNIHNVCGFLKLCISTKLWYEAFHFKTKSDFLMNFYDDNVRSPFGQCLVRNKHCPQALTPMIHMVGSAAYEQQKAVEKQLLLGSHAAGNVASLPLTTTTQ